jgi:adenosylcobinamide-GDP ribazoletransferase
MNPLLIALQFLTRFPVPVREFSREQTRDSIYWYGAAGAAIGLVLLAAQSLLLWLLPWDADVIVAALLLLLWVLITGALHLDGLADSADAWLGAHGDRDKALRIMKDPRCGPAGVVAVVLVLLLKFALLLYLQQQQQAAYLVLVPMLARALIPLLFFLTGYVRAEGLGSPFAEGLALQKILPGLAIALVAGLVLGGPMWLLACAIALVLFFTLRALMMRQFGGTTGDTAGALLEVLETGLLLGCVFMA